MGLKHYKIQLANLRTGENITSAGGKCYVTAAGKAQKTSLFNKDGSSAVNPISLTAGQIEFYTQDSVGNVDLYGQSPGGHGFVYKNVQLGGPDEIYVDTNLMTTDLVIPFSIADTTANTETSTGFTLPTNAVVQPAGGVDILTLNAGKTLNVGILSSEANGSATGFFNGLSTAALGAVPANDTITAGGTETFAASTTYGAFLEAFAAGANTAGRTGQTTKLQYRCDGIAHTVSYTLAAATVTTEGFIKLKYLLPSV